MTGDDRWLIEVVPSGAVRAGDVLLHISRGRVFELRVMSDPQPLGDFATEVEVCWPGEDVRHGFSLGWRGETHLRVVEQVCCEAKEKGER